MVGWPGLIIRLLRMLETGGCGLKRIPHPTKMAVVIEAYKLCASFVAAQSGNRIWKLRSSS